MVKRQMNFLKVGIFLVIVAVLIGVIFVVSQTNFLFSVFGQKEPKEFVNNVNMNILAPNWSIEIQNISTNNVSVTDFLFECANKNGFNVETEYWEGYDSFFIIEINNIKNGNDGKYWQYYVNGDYADMGCSKYYLDDNDIVEWRFESSRW